MIYIIVRWIGLPFRLAVVVPVLVVQLLSFLFITGEDYHRERALKNACLWAWDGLSYIERRN